MLFDLHALNVMRYKRGPPAVVDFPAVRQKLEIPLDHAGQAIRLGDAQTEPFLSSGRVEAFQNSPNGVALSLYRPASGSLPQATPHGHAKT